MEASTQQQGKRSLVLTYNTALAADIQRTLALMSIPSDSEGGGIAVRTVVSFIYSWMARLGIANPQEHDFDVYEDQCKETLDYISNGALGDTEISQIKELFPLEFGFDAILVDEAQDWPQPEADLLCCLYGGSAVSLADGIDQLVRGSPTNWKSSVVGMPKIGFRHLDTGLRMKSSLCTFANAFATELRLPGVLK